MFKELKQFFSSNNDKIVIVEDGEPRYVILPYAKYQALQKDESGSIVEEQLDTRPRPYFSEVNSEIEKVRSEEIRLEDLPF